MKQDRNNIIFLLLLFVLYFILFSVVDVSLAAQHSYTPLSPLPGSTVVDTTDPGSYLWTLFGIAVGVAAMLAVIMIIIGGFQYMTSEAIGSKESAKKRMWAAVLGLALILGSWLILNTINPNLLNLPFEGLKSKFQEAIIPNSAVDSTAGDAVNFGDPDDLEPGDDSPFCDQVCQDQIQTGG